MDEGLAMRRLRMHGDVWDTPLRWLVDGSQARTNFLDPYRPVPEVVEREAGAPLEECSCCVAFREGVRQVADEDVLLDVCRACWP